MKCKYCGQEHPDKCRLCPVTGEPLRAETGSGNEVKVGSSSDGDSDRCPAVSRIVITVRDAEGELACKDADRTRIPLVEGVNVIDADRCPAIGQGWCLACYDSCIVISVDLMDYDASQVKDMSRMFSDCTSLSSLDLSSFDTSRVNDMSRMFSGCTSLSSLDLSGFDTSRVKYMSSMFEGCSSLTRLDLSGFDTSRVESMSSMFSNCTSMSSLDLSGFDTSRIVMNMSRMFYGCMSLEEVIMRGCSDGTIAMISEALNASGVRARIVTE